MLLNFIQINNYTFILLDFVHVHIIAIYLTDIAYALAHEKYSCFSSESSGVLHFQFTVFVHVRIVIVLLVSGTVPGVSEFGVRFFQFLPFHHTLL